MTPTEAERHRCLKLIENTMRMHKHNPLVYEVLQRIRRKILRPKPEAATND